MLIEITGYISAFFAGIYLLFYCYRGPSPSKTIIKTTGIAVLCFCSIAVGGPLWLSLALGFCALGDFFLARGSESSFVKGVAAFALGHLAYIAAFLWHPLAAPALMVQDGNVAITTAILVFVFGMMVVLYPKAGKLAIPVMFYIPIIGAMAISSIGLPHLGPLKWIFPGAMIFLLSDFVLSVELFVLAKQSTLRKFTPFVVWSTYWLAQMLLFLGLVLPIS